MTKISIQLDGPQHIHGPLFLSDDGVAGKVRVSDTIGDQFDSVQVILEGAIHNSLCTLARPSAPTSRMEMAQKRESHQWDQHERVFPFHFAIPSHILIPKSGGGSSTDMVHPIPPSVYVNVGSVIPSSGQQRSLRGDCRITYTLRAYVIRNGGAIAGTLQHITLFPTLEPQPPSCTTDFPGDYVLSKSAMLRSTMLFRRLGDLFIETKEPSPLEFSRKKQEASTAIHLTLRFRESRESSKCETPPTPDYGVISLKLKQMTFVSVAPQRRLPATNDALKSPFLAKDSRIISEQSRKLKFPPWVRSRSKQNRGKHQGLFPETKRDIDEFIFSHVKSNESGRQKQLWFSVTPKTTAQLPRLVQLWYRGGTVFAWLLT
ncbi:hypothetical protein AJ79_04855 [Helicocarpus griseus UAMH5409]|uniref:Arrestin-like N-terminal domain-containing protein n=1 Tax=Helicocarpus griseus UAMH5409 TaxID=1447875 RepID=A0A2B7XR80_9EURO|nr:hypothetical protein AJ79_04855 [Helicocarpus griseus UAMH5409]